MALVLVEGPDLAGKSTFVNALARALTTHGDVQVIHRGPPQSHPLLEYEAPLTAYRPGTGRHVICDRWHVGERVYPELTGRKTELDDAVWTHVELFLKSRGALLIHLTAGDDTLERRHRQRGDDITHRDNLRARDLFRTHVTASLLHHITVHAEILERDLDYAVDLVATRARVAEDVARRLNPLATYVGSHAPELLLFGDVRANGPQARHLDLAGDVPAFMPFRATSGHYLLTALGEDVRRFNVGLANACDVDDPRRVWKTLGYPLVVALGRNAAKKLRYGNVNVPHREVAHPQFRRRFHHHDSEAYAAEILEIVRFKESKWSTS